MTNISDFVEEIKKIHESGTATEISYRPALVHLLNNMCDEVDTQTEPKRDVFGAPDFIFRKDDLILGYLEQKDIGKEIRDIDSKRSDQQARYLNATENLIYTNCLEWDFYRNGELIESVRIAELTPRICEKPKNYDLLKTHLMNFFSRAPHTITDPTTLAQHLANKALLIKEILNSLLDPSKKPTSKLHNEFEEFKKLLSDKLTSSKFADIYAESIAYGMFAARLHDKNPSDFNRRKAQDLLPKSNPFLCGLFKYIASSDLDKKLEWIIEDLAGILRNCNMSEIMKEFGSKSGLNDPFIYFYETFLTAYSPETRKQSGVWYTPKKVVNFIVRAVNDVLKSEFNIKGGLADDRKLDDSGHHRVQILDPAAGTGTFLAETIELIASDKDIGNPNVWTSYVESQLLPRLHGFELLMAPYAVCHMKIDMTLNRLGYEPTKNAPRLSVFLTDSLEDYNETLPVLPFASWLEQEVEGARRIKERILPIMCVFGNPPYLGEAGKGNKWVAELLEEYKKEPDSTENLREKNPKWLNDLYVKFFRVSSYLIEKNNEGILAFISNHGYLDNPTFRGMRYHLLDTFDKIWILDLHGNSTKKEKNPNGGVDQNIFNIKQGVSIIIALKKKNSKGGLAQIKRFDLWGSRKEKLDTLAKETIDSNLFRSINVDPPYYIFKQRNDVASKYDKGILLSEFMPTSSVGITTARDSLTIDFDRDRLYERIQEFASLDPESARIKFKLGKDTRDWKVHLAQREVFPEYFKMENLKSISYRPFDNRFIYYTGRSRGFICMSRKKVMNHLLMKDNIGLLIGRQGQVVGDMQWNLAFIQKGLVDLNIFYRGGGLVFPLYIDVPNNEAGENRLVNFDSNIFEKLKKIALYKKKDGTYATANELDILDYIYGILHSPIYRKTYADFLAIDFPRIPWPESSEDFWNISENGSKLRRLHLMEPDAIGDLECSFNGNGDNKIRDIKFKNEEVWINDYQFFDAVPEIAWHMHIGGYQPALKWLKDRKNMTLSYGDINHYRSIIKILVETDNIMKTISLSV